MSAPRTSKQHRKTAETDIRLSLNVDGAGTSDIKTGIGFFDHLPAEYILDIMAALCLVYLGLAAWRSATILNTLTGKELYPLPARTAFTSFGLEPRHRVPQTRQAPALTPLVDGR